MDAHPQHERHSARGSKGHQSRGATSTTVLRRQVRAKGRETMENQDIRTALDRHWAASAAGDSEAEHEIYHDDVLVEYPQSGERIRGRHNIQALRGHHPAKLSFTIRRILGSGDLWITEYVLSYNEQPTQTVSIMEFRDGKVARETQYFADPFEPPAWRTQWVEHQEK